MQAGSQGSPADIPAHMLLSSPLFFQPSFSSPPILQTTGTTLQSPPNRYPLAPDTVCLMLVSAFSLQLYFPGFPPSPFLCPASFADPSARCLHFSYILFLALFSLYVPLEISSCLMNSKSIRTVVKPRSNFSVLISPLGLQFQISRCSILPIKCLVYVSN